MTFVGMLALVVGAYHVVDGVVVVVNGGDASKLAEGAFDLALGVFALAIGGGALRMRRWAWAAFMTWAVVGLTHQLLRHFFYDHPNYLAMAFDTVAVLALTPLDVQIAFGVRPPRNVRPRPCSPESESTAADVEILRAFEPIVRYTQGEKFFPMDVERYVRASSLWLYVPDGSDEEVVPEGALTMEGLVERRDAPFGSLFYLRFVGPLDLQESAQALAGERRLAKGQQSEFHAGVGRLARGGLLPRLGDGLFSLSLLLRGKVPGATAAAAALKYAEMREQDERYVYQGRVVRQSGWTICQYWFFFAYNPWRSGFHGVNDHESDWEMISVYLYEEDGRLVPEWVAYASHDFHGADLRRRWDDRADLELVDGHPVVYAGAGSHASYFRAGEYQAEVPIPAPRRVRRLAEALGGFWRTTLGQGDETRSPLRIPFIDFARGDGLAIGPGQPQRVDAERDRRDDTVGEQVPRALGSVRAGPDLRRERPGRADVRPGRLAAPLLVRPARVRRARPGPAAAARARGPRRRARAARGPPERARPADSRGDLDPPGARRPPAEHAREPPSRHRVGEARGAGSRAGREAHGPSQGALGERSGPRGTPAADRAPAHRRRRRCSGAHPACRRARAGLEDALRPRGRALGRVLDQRPPRRAGGPDPGRARQRLGRRSIVLVIAFVVGESVLRGTFVRTVNRVAVILALVAVVVLFVQYWKLTLVALLRRPRRVPALSAAPRVPRLTADAGAGPAARR